MQFQKGNFLSIISLVFFIIFCGNTFASTIRIDQSEQNGQAVFTINYIDTPEMDSFGLDVYYDYNAVAYADQWERGDLTQDFSFINVNEPETGRITVAGFTVNPVPAGQSGSIAVLTFNKVLQQASYQITPANCVDDCPLPEDIPTPPVVPSGQSFAVNENSASGVIVGTVEANDDNDDVLAWNIIEGDPNGNFNVDESGVISVNSSPDFETRSACQLTVEVSDGADATPQTISIQINDMNDCPNADDQIFTVSEDALAGQPVGAITASDQDNDSLIYQLVSGNTGDAFSISNEGAVTVNAPLDYDTIQSYSLTVGISDGQCAINCIVTVNVTEVLPGNKCPIVSAQTFSIAENKITGASVGTIIADDPDGDTLTYSKVSGDPNNIFNLNAENGLIIVAGDLDYKAAPSFTISVAVGDGICTTTATITIKVKPMPGDVYYDQRVDLTDAITVLQILSGIAVDGLKIDLNADVNGNKRIGMEEVIFIMRELSKSEFDI